MTPSPLDDLETQKAANLAAIESVATLDELHDAEPALVGRRSALATLQRSLGSPKSAVTRARDSRRRAAKWRRPWAPAADF
jgi:hypothetical protein